MLIEQKETISNQEFAIITQYLEQSESDIEDEFSAMVINEKNDMWRFRTQDDGEFAPPIMPKRRLRAVDIY